jgi:uncharacterized protein YukE
VATGFTVHPSALSTYAEVIGQQAQAAATIHRALAAISVPAAAFGKLPEAGDLESAYHAHATAEIDNAAQMPELLSEVSERLASNGRVYAGLDKAQAGAIQQMFSLATGYAADAPAGGIRAGAVSAADSAIKWGQQVYQWTKQPEGVLPSIDPLQKMSTGWIGGMIDSAAMYVLEKTGLLDMLDKVTGNPDALHAAALAWRERGAATQKVAVALRAGARDLPDQWQGEASQAFGEFMGTVVASLDAMASDMGQTAQILNEAAQESQLAQDIIMMIIQQVIEWVAASLILDAITLGLSSVVDALADSAFAADKAAEAGEEVTRLERVLIDLRKALEDLQKAEQDYKDAEGFAKISKFLKLGGKLTDTIGALKGIKDLRYLKDSKVGGAIAMVFDAGEHAKGADPEIIEGARALGQDGVALSAGLKTGVKGVLGVAGLGGAGTVGGLAKSVGVGGTIGIVAKDPQGVADLGSQAFGDNGATGRAAYELPANEIDAILNSLTSEPGGSGGG